MRISYKRRLIAIFALTFLTTLAAAQSDGNSGSINGSVVDPTGAVVPKATVEIHNPVSDLIVLRPPTALENSPSPTFLSIPTI